jgi:hypothetical protein
MISTIIQPTKESVSVAEMARMVGLSRARFYQLIGSAFPFPLYQIATRRPFFNADLQQVCLEVRRRNCGIDGKPIMFYCRRDGDLPRAKIRRPAVDKKTPEPLAAVLESVHALGLSSVTLSEVAAAVKELFPSGWSTMPEGEVIRAVFIHLKRQNSHDNVAR